MKTYCFKLYKSKKNRYLHRQISISGMIYNHCIALHKRYYKIYKKSLNSYQLMKHITKLKRLSKYQYWNQVGSQAIQDVVERIDKSYKLFFRNRKNGIRAGLPGFKKVKNYKSFTLKQSGYKLDSDNKIKIGKRFFKYFKSQDTQGNIKTLTIKRDKLGDIYIYIVTDFVEVRDTPRTGKSVGFDFGLKTFLIASDNNDVISPLFFTSNIRSIRKANQKVSKKIKGSKNRRKSVMNLERLHNHVTNQRSDFHWKLANDLTDKYDYLFFEDLNIKSMQKLWGRKISDLAFYSFMQKLKYIATIKNKTVFCIGRFEPSSKTCSDCGNVNKELELKDRSWCCPNCGTVHDRDRNASFNILRVGTSTLGLEDVRPEVSGDLCLNPESHDL